LGRGKRKFFRGKRHMSALKGEGPKGFGGGRKKKKDPFDIRRKRGDLSIRPEKGKLARPMYSGKPPGE